MWRLGAVPSTSHRSAECSPISSSFPSSYICSFIVLLGSLGTVPLDYQEGLCLWSRCCCRVTSRRGEQFGEDAALGTCMLSGICNEWSSADRLYSITCDEFLFRSYTQFSCVELIVQQSPGWVLRKQVAPIKTHEVSSNPAQRCRS